MKTLNEYKIVIEKESETAFRRDKGIAQDGTTPMYRDKDGQ